MVTKDEVQQFLNQFKEKIRSLESYSETIEIKICKHWLN